MGHPWLERLGVWRSGIKLTGQCRSCVPRPCSPAPGRCFCWFCRSGLAGSDAAAVAGRGRIRLGGNHACRFSNVCPAHRGSIPGGICAFAWSTVDRRRPTAARPSRHDSLVPSLAAPVLLSFRCAGSRCCDAILGRRTGTVGRHSPADADRHRPNRIAEKPSITRRSTQRSATPPLVATQINRDKQTLPSRVYRVFVPVDADRRPVGSKLYVPEELFQGLSRRAARAIQQPGDWLMTRASYQLLLSRENAQETVAVAECKAIFDLEVFRAGTELSIPLGGMGGMLVRGSAKLDGRPIDIDRPNGADHLSFVADQAGLARLEVSFTPEIQSDGTTAGFDLSVPPLPISSLAVSFAGEPVPIDIPTARGQTALLSTVSTVQAELGPSGHLAVRWPEDKRTAAIHPNVDVEELLWVTLQAGSPVVDARFKCRAAEGRIHHLRISGRSAIATFARDRRAVEHHGDSCDARGSGHVRPRFVPRGRSNQSA